MLDPYDPLIANVYLNNIKYTTLIAETFESRYRGWKAPAIKFSEVL